MRLSKKILLHFCLPVFLLTANLPQAKSQDPVAIYEGVKVAYDLYKVGNYVWQNYGTKIKYYFTGMQKTWWYAQYEDGFVVYNDFRYYRTFDNVFNYFIGHGDCDAVYDGSDGREYNLCYRSPQDASNYTDRHGPIVDIGFKGRDGVYRSVWELK